MQDVVDVALARRLWAERTERDWSIADLSRESGVSRAMISKVERGEASPTASLLGRLSGAFGLTLSQLLVRAERDAGAPEVRRLAAQPAWRDPESGYVRRAVSPPGVQPELVWVELPPGARVAFSAGSYRRIAGQCVLLLRGELLLTEDGRAHRLGEGDCYAFSRAAARVFGNPGEGTCAYIVALHRATGPDQGGA